MKNETEEGSVTNNNEGNFNGTNIEDGNKKTDLGIKKEKKQMDKVNSARTITLSHIAFFFSSRRRHTRFLYVSWARRCV